MSVKKILELGNPLLWQRSDDVDDPSSPSVAAVARDLADTLEAFQFDHGWGRGIAAPQIGQPLRVIAIGGDSVGFSEVLVNPRIAGRSENRLAMWDGCFSFPGLVVGLWRAERIEVEYTGLDGAGRTIPADWIVSQLLQHEIDHLDGILAVQRAISPKHIITRQEWERQGRPEFVSPVDGAS